LRLRGEERRGEQEGQRKSANSVRHEADHSVDGLSHRLVQTP
jgi:hypothetical protein